MGVEGGNGVGGYVLWGNEGVSQGGDLRDELADSTGGDCDPSQHSRGPRKGNLGEFIQFLRIAQGSLKELETHLILASRVELANAQQVAPTLEKRETIGKCSNAPRRIENEGWVPTADS